MDPKPYERTFKSTKYVKSDFIIHIDNRSKVIESQEEGVRANLFPSFKFEDIERHVLNFSEVIRSSWNTATVPEAKVGRSVTRQFSDAFACLKKAFFYISVIGWLPFFVSWTARGVCSWSEADAGGRAGAAGLPNPHLHPDGHRRLQTGARRPGVPRQAGDDGGGSSSLAAPPPAPTSRCFVLIEIGLCFLILTQNLRSG